MANTNQLKKLTQGDIRALTGLTRAQLRYWSKVLPPLRGKRGRRACYSPAEAFALRVLASVVNEIACDVSVLASSSKILFKAVHGGDWQRFEHKCIVIQPREGIVEFPFVTEPPAEWPPKLFVSLGLAPYVQEVRNFALGTRAKPTETRQLPLVDARKRRRVVPHEQKEGSAS